MLCPIILGSDKTVVSVATGNTEYHPVYLSIGNLHNSARRAHRNSLIPVAFLAIPTGSLIPGSARLLANADSLVDRDEESTKEFRTFKRQLLHTSLSTVLRSLRPNMTTPVVLHCPDRHFRKVIFDLAAYIADYPEQCDLTCVVQGWCCR